MSHEMSIKKIKRFLLPQCRSCSSHQSKPWIKFLPSSLTSWLFLLLLFTNALWAFRPYPTAVVCESTKVDLHHCDNSAGTSLLNLQLPSGQCASCLLHAPPRWHSSLNLPVVRSWMTGNVFSCAIHFRTRNSGQWRFSWHLPVKTQVTTSMEAFLSF